MDLSQSETRQNQRSCGLLKTLNYKSITWRTLSTVRYSHSFVILNLMMASARAVKLASTTITDNGYSQDISQQYDHTTRSHNTITQHDHTTRAVADVFSVFNITFLRSAFEESTTKVTGKMGKKPDKAKSDKPSTAKSGQKSEKKVRSQFKQLFQFFAFLSFMFPSFLCPRHTFARLIVRTNLTCFLFFIPGR